MSTRQGPELAITRRARLFNTNIAFRKPEKVCMEGEFWPVAVRQNPQKGSKRR